MVTQKDIASRLGVSISLVSRVLAGKGDSIGASQETRRRIRRVAAELGYMPNVAACILKGAPSRTLGVVVYDFSDPFFGLMSGELQRLAREAGYSLIVTGLERRQSDTHDLAPLLRHDIDGLIILGSQSQLDWIEPFSRRGLPAVRIGSGTDHEGLFTMQVDEEQGLRLLLRHLRDCGHNSAGFAGAAEEVDHRRAECFREVAAELQMETQPGWIVLSEGERLEAGRLAGRRILNSAGGKPTALATSSDLVACGLIRALLDRQYRVPQHISVTGFDDIPLAHLLHPALTTVKQPYRSMCRQALQIFNGQDPPAGRRLFAPELRQRESTAPAPVNNVL